MIRDPGDEIGKAMAAALSAKVKARAEQPAREKPTREGSARWQPPRCSRRGCSNPADVSKRDYDAEMYSVAKGIVKPGRKWYCKANNYQCAKFETERAHGRRGRFKEAPARSPHFDSPGRTTIGVSESPERGYDDI